jgi:hypothetical protein
MASPLEAKRVIGSIKQRHFRCEVSVARKRYTEDPAVLRQPQGHFGYAMSASAHFPNFSDEFLVRCPFKLIWSWGNGGKSLFSAYFSFLQTVQLVPHQCSYVTTRYFF